jgi:acyl dehydratase
MVDADSPFFDDLTTGDVFSRAPAMTLTEGLAAVHQSIVGDRLAVALDHDLSQRVTSRVLAHPGLVWDIAIGQSTVVTRRVKANLFYRGLVFHRAPAIGDTLRTVTEVVALRQNSQRANRANTGLAALRMMTTDQEGRPVLDFFRCAMIPLRVPDGVTGHDDDIDAVGAQSAPVSFDGAIADWSLEPMSHVVDPATLAVGDRFEVVGGDVVSGAPELARLTLNIAVVHHDAGESGRRLVYGGHAIGIALAQASRAIPSIVTVTGWHSCDHLAPVYEGDTVRSVITVERLDQAHGGTLAHLRSVVTADGDEPRTVLDWRFVCLVA